MSHTLYPHQLNFITAIRTSLAKYRRIIACGATGMGKSKVFISMAQRAVEKGTTVLIISESTKIYGQIHREIGDTTNIGDGVKEFYLHAGKIYVAMCQTLAKRQGLITQFQALSQNLLIINDEAHVGTSTKLLKQFPNAYLIGFTATPNFKDAKHLPELYRDCVVGPQPQELVEMGYLTPYNHYARQVVNLSALKKSSKGEFTEASQESAFEKKAVFDCITEDLLKFKFRKCMIYCASIKHCKDVVGRLREIGYDASECHSKNPKSDYELFEFTHGANNICVSVGSLTKGFDEPAIDFIILNRATTSLSLYNQMIGRGSRKIIGKDSFNVLDLGGNGKRHHAWNYEHDWANMWKGKSKKLGAAPMKFCPDCGFMISATIMVCPECQHVYEKKPEDLQRETELVEITERFNKLRGRKISTLSAQELHFYVQQTNKKPFAKLIARANGEAFLTEYAKCAKWNYGWWNHCAADDSLKFFDITIR